jgi:hypothetical protein
MRILFLFVLLLGGLAVNAQSVIRGPYLQTPTHEAITVMWRTDVPAGTSLWLGTEPGSLMLHTSTSTALTDHAVTIVGLEPYTTYYYAVGQGATMMTMPGQQYRFRTHPVPGSEQPIRVWAIGDFGKGNAGQVAVKQSYLAHPGGPDTDVWIWLGDNVYDDGKDTEYQSKVFGLSGFSDVFNWLPFYPSPGNHDYNEVWRRSTLFGLPYSNIPLENHDGPYYDIVDVPEVGEAGGYPSQLEVFYSFDHGNVHFLSLNSEVYDFLNTSDGIDRMKDWIEQDLEVNDKPWVIAYFHQPPYSKGSHDSDGPLELVMRAMRERVVPLLEQYDVDLVICGHSHVYERSHLVHGHYGNSGSWDPATMLKDGGGGDMEAGTPYAKDNDPATPDGTVYVVCGNSGSGNSDGSMDHPIMVSNFNGDGVYGSFYMDIHRNRLDGRYLLTDGTIGDRFTIVKSNMRLQQLQDVPICQGASVVVTASRTGGSDDVLYAWSPGGFTGEAVQLAPETTTTYTLFATDQLTGQVDSTSFTVQVEEPVLAEITATGDTIQVLPGYSYQWYLNGDPVTGENLHYVVDAAPGIWTVVIAHGPCATEVGPYYQGTTTVAMASAGSCGLHVFPHPTGGPLTVVVGRDGDQPRTIRLMDFTGRTVIQAPVDSDRLGMDLSGLAPGGYLLRLEGPSGVQATTMVIRE